MAAPVVETKVKEVPVLSSKSKQPRPLAKPKKKILRNLLVKPYEDYWPEITDEEEECVRKAFQKLVEEENNNVNVNLEEKQFIASKRKKLLENLAIGINNVPRCIKNGSVVAVLIAADVDPKFLVQHVVTLCGATAIPILIVSSLRLVTKNLFGFSSIAVGIKKIVAESNTNSLHDIYKLIKKIAGHHKPPAAIQQFAEAADESSDSEPEEATDSSEQSPSAVVPATDVYLYRSSTESRVFVPKSQKIEVTPEVVPKAKVKLEDFVSLGDDSDDLMETDEPVRGISYTLINPRKKQRRSSPPKYVPFKYMKVQPNPNKKRH